MKIQRATFIGVRGVPDLTLDLTDARTGAPHALVVVSGPSGSGKTRMLEALIAAKEAIRPYGAMAAGEPWIGAGSAAKVLVTFHLDEAEREFAGTASHSLEGEVIFLPDRANAEAELAALDEVDDVGEGFGGVMAVDDQLGDLAQGEQQGAFVAGAGFGHESLPSTHSDYPRRTVSGEEPIPSDSLRGGRIQ